MKRNTASLSTAHCQHISPPDALAATWPPLTIPISAKPIPKSSAASIVFSLAELYQAAGSLDAPQDVLRVLSKVFLATTKDQITPRKAAVLGYLGQMLLRAHREIAYHQKIETQRQLESGELEDIFDVPHLIRDDPPDPPKSGADSTSASAASSNAAQPAATANPASSNHHTQSVAASNIALDAAPPPPAKPDLRHFYHYDPILPPGTQDINNTIPPELRHKSPCRWTPPKRRHHYP